MVKASSCGSSVRCGRLAGLARHAHGLDPFGAGPDVDQSVSAAARGFRREAAAIVLHEEADFAVALMHSHRDVRGVAVAQCIAHGLARNLQRFETLLRGEEGRRFVVGNDPNVATVDSGGLPWKSW